MMWCLLMVLALQDTASAREAYDAGRKAFREQKFDDAAKAFERATQLNPNSSTYYLWLGHAYTRQLSAANFMRKPIIGRKIGPQYDKAVELDSSSVAAAEARVEFYLEAPGIAGGGVDKARAEAVRLTKLSAYRGAFAAARIAEKDNNWDKVQAEFHGLIAAHPDSVTPYFYYGRAAALSGKELSRGAEALERFLELLGVEQPQSRAIAHYRLGTIREKQGDVVRARAAYDSAVALNPQYGDAVSARKRLAK